MTQATPTDRENYFCAKLPHTKPCSKFQISSSSNFGDIDSAMVDVTLNKGQGHSFWYQSSISQIGPTTSYRLSIVTFALGRTV